MALRGSQCGRIRVFRLHGHSGLPDAIKDCLLVHSVSFRPLMQAPAPCTRMILNAVQGSAVIRSTAWNRLDYSTFVSQSVPLPSCSTRRIRSVTFLAPARKITVKLYWPPRYLHAQWQITVVTFRIRKAGHDHGFPLIDWMAAMASDSVRQNFCTNVST